VWRARSAREDVLDAHVLATVDQTRAQDGTRDLRNLEWQLYVPLTSLLIPAVMCCAPLCLAVLRMLACAGSARGDSPYQPLPQAG
jgi:hypothetical protein